MQLGDQSMQFYDRMVGGSIILCSRNTCAMEVLSEKEVKLFPNNL